MNHPLMTVLYQRVAQRVDLIMVKLESHLTTQAELDKLRKRELKLRIKKLEVELGHRANLKEEEK